MKVQRENDNIITAVVRVGGNDRYWSDFRGTRIRELVVIVCSSLESAREDTTVSHATIPSTYFAALLLCPHLNYFAIVFCLNIFPSAYRCLSAPMGNCVKLDHLAMRRSKERHFFCFGSFLPDMLDSSGHVGFF